MFNHELWQRVVAVQEFERPRRSPEKRSIGSGNVLPMAGVKPAGRSPESRIYWRCSP